MEKIYDLYSKRKSLQKCRRVDCQSNSATATEYCIEKKKCCCTCSLRTGVLCIAIFQLVSVLVWAFEIFFVIVLSPEKHDTNPPSVIYIGIVNGLLTFACSIHNFVSYCLKSESVLLVSSVLEIILTACLLITSLILFFYRIWIISFVGIIFVFLFFYFFSVINSYKEELRQLNHLSRFGEPSARSLRY